MPKKTPAKKPAVSAASEPFFRPFAGLAVKSKPAKAPAEAPKASPPRAAPPPPKPAEPVASEAETFAMLVAGVRALDAPATRIPKSAARLEPKPAAPQPAGPDPDAEARSAMRALVTEGLRFDVSDDGRIAEGRRVDVDPRELRRLRKGAYHVDGKLDLHGMGAAPARDALEAFLRKRRAEGDRVVLVVHGKGTHSPAGVPILRGEIGAWLSQGRAARDVAAFTSMPDDDGRSGSMLVLLAR